MKYGIRKFYCFVIWGFFFKLLDIFGYFPFRSSSNSRFIVLGYCFAEMNGNRILKSIDFHIFRSCLSSVSIDFCLTFHRYSLQFFQNLSSNLIENFKKVNLFWSTIERFFPLRSYDETRYTDLLFRLLNTRPFLAHVRITFSQRSRFPRKFSTAGFRCKKILEIGMFLVHGADLLMLDYFHGMIVFRFVDFLIAWKFYKHLAEKGMGWPHL